jgi:hypothetical protein
MLIRYQERLLTEACYESAGDELSITVRGALNDFANGPENESKHQGSPSSKPVADEDRQNRRREAANVPCSHRDA